MDREATEIVSNLVKYMTAQHKLVLELDEAKAMAIEHFSKTKVLLDAALKIIIRTQWDDSGFCLECSNHQLYDKDEHEVTCSIGNFLKEFTLE